MDQEESRELEKYRGWKDQEEQGEKRKYSYIWLARLRGGKGASKIFLKRMGGTKWRPGS